jgi:diguanylate cyclase (GGDEF)-like protein
MLPLAVVIVGGSLILMVGLPLLFNYSINNPLGILTDGVQRMEAGNLSITLPVQYDDEIGFLTAAFNGMAARLKNLVTNLEDEVSKRTEELAAANQCLTKQLSEIAALQAELREQAIRDPLTNAFNRRFFLEALNSEIAQAAREGFPIALVMIDLDHFKQISDRFGHKAGDLVLQQFVNRIVSKTRKGDVLCRYGGEEFVVMMPYTNLADAYQRAEEWRITCENLPIEHGGNTLTLTISSGVTASQNPGMTAEELLEQADQAMYQAKSAGRNRTVISGNFLTEL